MLERVNCPEDLKKLSPGQLRELAEDVRELIKNTVSATGGHLASNLGVVELTIAMHYVYDSPRDKFIFDVGHQCYVHKILTGRKERFHTLRQHKGICGFPSRKESPFDCYGAGHASTSVSAAVGIAMARDLKKEKFDVVALIGDGSLTGGLAFEGINNLGTLGLDCTVILNDNKMSISSNVGAMARYLGQLSDISRDKRDLKTIFHSLGFRFMGPVDGHDLQGLIEALRESRKCGGPVLIHVRTEKGKGYPPAESDKAKFHGLGPFNLENGAVYSSSKVPTYTSVFSRTLVRLAEEDPGIVGITAAMPSGTGMDKFGERFPDRFFDVGIAEQHAVVFAAGLASQGFRPFCAIYSTFLQRAYDQVLHDVCLQNLPVVFCLDRAGLVGDDGPTHHGCYDLSFLRSVPNLVLMAPKDENELQHMLYTASVHDGPVAIRYPRGAGVGVELDPELEAIETGRAEILREGTDGLILAIGPVCHLVEEALESVPGSFSLVNARFVKPLDEETILRLAGKADGILTIEENSREGGFGSAVLELLARHGVPADVKVLGIPDAFVEHGDTELLKKNIGLSKEEISKAIRRMGNAHPGVPGRFAGVVRIGGFGPTTR